MSKYQATIDVLANVINGAPASFPADELGEIKAKISVLEKNETISRAELEDALAALGREVMPWVGAYNDFYNIYGEPLEHGRLQEKLSAPAAAAYLKFIGQGNGVEDVRNAKKFEEFFDPELRAEIVEAELTVHDAIREEMNRMIENDKKDEFADLLAREKEKIDRLDQEIIALAALAPRAEKWSSEILDKARVFRLGLAGLEPLPETMDIKKEIEYYVDIMELQ